MTFLTSKQPPFEKTTSSNDNAKVSLTEKKTCKIFGNFELNCKTVGFFFDCSRVLEHAKIRTVLQSNFEQNPGLTPF